MELKLKDGVFGFTWNFEDGEIGEVFTEQLTPREMELVSKVSGDDVCVILSNEDIVFVFDEDIVDQDELVEMGLDGVMELV